jgi:hypothetical protein
MTIKTLLREEPGKTKPAETTTSSCCQENKAKAEPQSCCTEQPVPERQAPSSCGCKKPV